MRCVREEGARRQNRIPNKEQAAEEKNTVLFATIKWNRILFHSSDVYCKEDARCGWLSASPECLAFALARHLCTPV